MKIFLSLLFFTSLVLSCSTTPSQPTTPDMPKPSQKYLALKDIEELLDNTKSEEIKFDKETVDRYLNLIPLNELFTKTPDVLIEDNAFISMFDARDLPKSIDLREYANETILNQFGGTCTAHAITAVTEIASCTKKNVCGVKLSERHAWSLYKKYSSDVAIQALLKNRIVENKYWPHKDEKSKYKNLSELAKVKLESVYKLNTEKVILEFLANKSPVNLAMTVPSGMLNCSPVIKKTSKATDGGHAIAVVGYHHSERHGTILIIRNSWGKSCGDGGYQYMQLDVCKNKDFYCSFHGIDNIDVIK